MVRAEQAEAALAGARRVLAHTDMGSLPNDWTLAQVAEARIDDMLKLREQVRDTCARAERAEARIAELEAGLLKALDGWEGHNPYVAEFDQIAVVRALLKASPP